MAAPRRSRPHRGRAAWSVVGVTLLAIFVMALSYVALMQHGSVVSAGSTPGTTAAPGADVTAPPTEGQSPESAPAAVTPVAVPNRVIAAIDVDSAVRVVATECPTPSTIETTGDAGATWRPLEAAAVASVQRVSADADAFVSLLGLATEGCAPDYEQSFVGGEAWETAPDELAASWFIDPANRAGVHSPTGDRQAPCAVVVQVAVIDENSAAVLCDDASVHATTDAGNTWMPPAPVPGAAAIGVGADAYRVAVVNQNGCAGAQLVGLGVAPGGLAPIAAGACLPATVAPGEAAVASAADGTTWLWAGDALGRTQDGGATWL
ncbi:hypothetical protein [Agromyces bauzanensis]|uniref:Uncharacterized protein n=1 Tax=Agromyces bauzanensis TaxID=1308924 RepID=A0A917PT67_9MICO|nr:hypothetical protein [Agromyces bauzanensis]GGJ90161.1 hypothetical protein GCM10011372_30880 [Agromyces bauzanensis]